MNIDSQTTTAVKLSSDRSVEMISFEMISVRAVKVPLKASLNWSVD